jgi:hypothetical protein
MFVIEPLKIICCHRAYGGSGHLHAAATLPTGTHWIGGWADPRVGLDDVEKRKILDCTRTLTLGCPAHCYPGSLPVLVWGATVSAHLGVVSRWSVLRMTRKTRHQLPTMRGGIK